MVFKDLVYTLFGFLSSGCSKKRVTKAIKTMDIMKEAEMIMASQIQLFGPKVDEMGASEFFGLNFIVEIIFEFLDGSCSLVTYASI